MKSLTELKANLQQETSKIVSIANAEDKGVLLFVKTALEEQLCQFMLFGDKNKIEEISKEIDLDLSSTKIQVYHETSDTAGATVKSVYNKEAHIVMKGNLSTKRLLKAVLNKENGLRTGNVLSHVALFEVPTQERLIFLTDAALNIAPTLTEKQAIIHNVVNVAQSIGISKPKVAAIAPIEVVNESMTSTTDAAILSQMNRRGQIKGCIVDGPLAFDNAVSTEAAVSKGIVSEVAGSADIILVPSIEVGNALYKSFIYFAKAKVAAIISGARAPIVLTSRSDSVESKLYSLILALYSTK